MRLSRPSLEQPPHPRPIRATEVLLDIEDEQDDGVEFDPQRDLRPTDWEGMKGKLEELRGVGDWWNFSFMAADLSLLFQDRKDDLKLNDEAFEGMKRELEESRGNDWGRFQFMALDLSLLFPDRKDKLDLDNEAFERMKRELERYRGTKDWWNFGYMAMLLALVFPDCKAELKLDKAFEGMKGKLEEYRGTKNWGNFSGMAMRLALLFPEHKEELNLNDEAFTGMKGKLEKFRGKDWGRFTSIATNLTILAADSAQITHDGRILIVPKKPRLSVDPKPLPKQSRL